MPCLNRRRFLAISGAAVAGGAGMPARASTVSQWRGVAMGSAASITLDHPNADQIIAHARVEIERLEDIFSLYRAGSTLSQLNANGSLDNPPFELLEVLGLCGSVHHLSGGLFDPTVQPLWAAYAEAFAAGSKPSDDAIDQARSLIAWDAVRYDATNVSFGRPGMALTLNGVAQGYVADRVAALLAAEGVKNILIDTGEIQAMGAGLDGEGWDISLAADQGSLTLRDRALASSAPKGTVFDVAGTVGHILDPRAGTAATAEWELVSVTASSAALADALSTAMCLMARPQIMQMVDAVPDATLVALA